MTSAILINESDSGANYRSRIQKLLDNSASFTARNILRDRLNSASVSPRASGERPFFRSYVTCATRVNDHASFLNEPRVPRPMPYETLRSAESYLGRRMSDRRLSITDSDAYNVQLGDPSKKVRITVDGPSSPRVPSSPESPSITFTFRVPKKTQHIEETVNATVRVPSPSASSSDSAPSTPWKESSVYTPPDFTRQYSASSRLSKPESHTYDPAKEASAKIGKESEIDSSYARPFDRLSTARSSLGRSEPRSYTRRSTRPQTVFGEPSLDRKSSASDDHGSTRPTFSVNLRSRPSDTPSPKKHCDRPSPRPSSVYDNFGRPDIPRVERSRISPDVKQGNGQTVTSERKFIFPRRKDSSKLESEADKSSVIEENGHPPRSPSKKFFENPLYKSPEAKDQERIQNQQQSKREQSTHQNTPNASAFRMGGGVSASPKITGSGTARKIGESSVKTPPRDTPKTVNDSPKVNGAKCTRMSPDRHDTSQVRAEKNGAKPTQPSPPPRTRKPSPAKTANPNFETKTAHTTYVNYESAAPHTDKRENVSQIRIIPIEVLDRPHVRIIPIHIEGDDKENRDRRSSTSSSSSRRAASMAPNSSRNGTIPDPPQRSRSYAMPSRASFRRSRSRSSSREQTPTPNDCRYSSKRVLDLLNELSDESAPMPANKKCSKSEAWNLRLAEEKKDEGNKFYKQKDYRRALACYTKAVELFPCASYYGNRAACYIMLGMYTQALQDARESVRCEPTFAKGHLRMGKCFLAMGDTVAARSAFDRSKELEPSNTTIDAELRTIDTLTRFETDLAKAFDGQEYRKALYCCERALDIAVFCRRFKVKKAECLAYLGRYPEAEEIVNDTLRSDNTDVDALLIRGLCLYYQDNLDLAFSHFQQVLRLAPDHVKAREVYRKAKQLKTKKEEGNTAFKQGKLTEALSLYTDALAIDPLNKLTNAKLFYNRALVNSKLGKYQQSVQDCSEAIKLDEGYVKAFLLRAKSYSDLEKYEECVRDYETCMKLEKNANRETRRLLQEAKIALKRSKRKDYYKILGVDKNANEDDIKKAYRKRALVHHPDRHSNATEEERKEHEKLFKDLGEAYGVLSDPKKKARYDRGQDLDDDGHADFDPQMFNAFFGAGPSPFGGFHFGGGSGGFHHGGFNFQF